MGSLRLRVCRTTLKIGYYILNPHSILYDIYRWPCRCGCLCSSDVQSLKVNISRWTNSLIDNCTLFAVTNPRRGTRERRVSRPGTRSAAWPGWCATAASRTDQHTATQLARDTITTFSFRSRKLSADSIVSPIWWKKSLIFALRGKNYFWK